jgi:hypothetical protein
MARTIDQVKNSLISTISSIDDRVDLKVGPVWDYLLAPLPTEFSFIESEIERLKRYYSPIFSTVATPEEARDFALNFGTSVSVGGFARCPIVFYRNSPPPTGSVFTVPTGSLVMTIDNNLVYRTIQAVEMSGNYASTYFNPSTLRYEVTVTVEAVSPGEKYNIPPKHIQRMQPNIQGFDGVTQYVEAGGGTPAEDSIAVAQRVQEKFKGLEKNSIGGITTNIKQSETDIVKSVTVVKPTDRQEFRRLTNGPSLDVYINGTDSANFTEEYLATGSEVTVQINNVIWSVVPILVNKTVTSISSVLVNGIVLSSAEWTFFPDTTAEYQQSTMASPTIGFASPLLPNALVEISGVRNDVLDRVQLLYTGSDALFETSVLVRTYLDMYIVATIEIKINDGDTDAIQQLAYNVLSIMIEPSDGTIPQIIIPSQISDTLRAAIPEIATIKMLEFRRKYGSISAVETIVPLKNQLPKFDTVASAITVRL